MGQVAFVLFPIDALDFAVNEDGDNHDVVIQNTSGYERTLNRFIEMVDQGLDVLLLLMPLRQGASPNVFSERSAQRTEWVLRRPRR